MSDAGKDTQARIHELLRAGRHADAERLLTEICARPTVAAESWFLLGALAGMRGDATMAERRFRDALALEPEFTQARFNLGIALRDQGRTEEAVKELRGVVTQKPHHFEAHSALGYLYIRLEQPGEAERCFRAALAHNPKHVDALINLANILSSRRQWHEAEILYRRALAIVPGNADAAINLGSVLVIREKFKDALSTFEQIQSVAPSNSDAYAKLGIQIAIAFKRLSDLETAKRVLRAVLRLFPQHEEAQFEMATLGGAASPERAPSEYVAKVFDDYADIFDEHLGRLQYKAPEALYRALEANFKQDRELYTIDLGCGTGLCGPLFRRVSHTLVGVDLSSKMIEKARARAIYDELYVDDLVPALLRYVDILDLALAADVFVYMGDLQSVFDATSRALHAGGLFAFTIESAQQNEGDTYTLRSSGRYAHANGYILQLAHRFGLDSVLYQEIHTRLENNTPVAGAIFILKKA